MFLRCLRSSTQDCEYYGKLRELYSSLSRASFRRARWLLGSTCASCDSASERVSRVASRPVCSRKKWASAASYGTGRCTAEDPRPRYQPVKVYFCRVRGPCAQLRRSASARSSKGVKFMFFSHYGFLPFQTSGTNCV